MRALLFTVTLLAGSGLVGEPTASAQVTQIDKLVVALKDPSPAVRVQAVRRLVWARPRAQASRAIVSALQDREEVVRAIAAEVLSVFISEESVRTALAIARSDPSEMVRKYAEGSLSKWIVPGPPSKRLYIEIAELPSRPGVPADLDRLLRESVRGAVREVPGITFGRENAAEGGFVIEAAVEKLSRQVSAHEIKYDFEVSYRVLRLPDREVVLTTSQKGDWSGAKGKMTREQERQYEREAIGVINARGHVDVERFVRGQRVFKR